MKLLSIGHLASSLVVCLGCFCCTPATENYQFITKDLIDLGTFEVGQKMNFTIPLTNPTDHYLKIVKAEGTCGCLTINKRPTGLGAKQDGMISATFDSGHERKNAGVIYKNVVVQLDRKPFVHAVKIKVAIL